MMMEGLPGLCVAGSSPHHSSPAKRSFDVAFLTGARDPPSGPPSSGGAALAKVTRLGDDLDLRKGSRDDAPGSAFTKVTRASSVTSSSSVSLASTLTSSGPLGSALDALGTAWPPVSASSFSSLLGTAKLGPLLAAPGLLPPSLASFLPSPAESLNNNLVEEYLKSQHSLEAKLAASTSSSTSSSGGGGDLSPSEALSRLRTSIYPSTGDPYKLPFPSLPLGEGSKMATGGPYLSPPPPPPSASLMPPSLSALALSSQNVCAKCNISFRMTSDLVYHMRSQHKREPDPYKKRRNEKLKCGFCGESFRERHHLTRHMSAHQDHEEEEEGK